jgi:hypothetical protein
MLGFVVAVSVTVTLGAHAVAQPADPRTVLVVAPGGDDEAPGSAERPWRTISHAARAAPPGALVDIRGGTYNERVVVKVSGAAGTPTSFVAHPGERVTITGRGLRGFRVAAGLIDINGRSNLEFVGLELRDLVDRRARYTPAGVWVRGKCRNITLRRLDVHDIRTRGGNAHGIAVYGMGSSPTTGVAIEDSSVHDLRLGLSEAIAVNGNVAGWRVTGNTIDDVDNIGIDAIGFEGTAPRGDRARNGLIAGNVVSDVDTLGNPAYDTGSGGNYRSAGGIYVDGGDDVVIERNLVTRANYGVVLASEARRGVTSEVVVRSNLVSRSDQAGLTMGGYDSQRGRTERVRVVNNTFTTNDLLHHGLGELQLRYRVLNSSVLNNVFSARPQGFLVTNAYRQNRGNLFDGNVWFSPGRSEGGAVWQWRKKRVHGFAAWQTATGHEQSAHYADPLVGPDGRPAPGSPLIDAGVATPFAGDTDLAGVPRLQGVALDAGAFETTP